MSYNGYRNWETWLFMVHFGDYLFETLRERQEEGEKFNYQEVYNTVESLIYEMLDGVENIHIGGSFLKDLLNASLNEVDVEEIADLLFEDLKEE